MVTIAYYDYNDYFLTLNMIFSLFNYYNILEDNNKMFYLCSYILHNDY